MNLRSVVSRALPLAIAIVLVAACGDDADDAPVEDTPSVSGEEPPVSDGAGREAPPSPAAVPDAQGDGAESPAAAAQRTGPVYSVQLGAFQREENATALQRRLEEEGLPTWTTEADVGDEGFMRVRVGATSTVAEARQLMERIRGSVQGEAWIAPVAPDEELPDGVMDDTGVLLRNG